MAKQIRRNLDGQYFHVMVQGIGKEYVFPDDNSKGYYLSCLKNYKEEYPVKILAFCVMGNHAHVLLSVNNSDELSKYMKRVGEDYARYYNRAQDRVGYVFRSRFKSEVIRSEKHLVYCVAYIQNNPLKARLVEWAEEYPYSSYSNYLLRTGIVDFAEAGIFFDTAPDYMAGLMAELTDSKWLEHDDKEGKAEVLAELIERYRFTPGELKDKDLVREIAMELRERTGISIRSAAELLFIDRETLRRLLSRGQAY
ncbi:MAG: transposase [Firmicutes bacterium]|nr:transposase [Bacillota bacterium]